MDSSPSKAWVRATRERVGLSQKALADRLGNTVDMVKKWENPKYSEPPEDACRLLESCLKAHRRAVSVSVEQVETIERQTGSRPSEVTLSYFRSQRHYDEYGRDQGTYGIVNARSREIAAVLESKGYAVQFVYPEDRDETMFTALANTREQ